MGCGQFSWGPCPAGCSGGPWSKWSYLDRGKREGGREVQRVEGRKEDSGEGEEEEQADTRDPEQEKGQEWREVTGARSVGEKFGKRQREKVVRLPSLPWNRVVPQGLANREAGTASRSHGWKGPELGLGLFAPHSELLPKPPLPPLFPGLIGWNHPSLVPCPHPHIPAPDSQS